MKKFNIVIKDLETGETLVDDVTSAIVGSFEAGERGAAAMAFVSCKTRELLQALRGAEDVIEKIYVEHPELLIKGKMLELLDLAKAVEERGETE